MGAADGIERLSKGNGVRKGCEVIALDDDGAHEIKRWNNNSITNRRLTLNRNPMPLRPPPQSSGRLLVWQPCVCSPPPPVPATAPIGGGIVSKQSGESKKAPHWRGSGQAKPSNASCCYSCRMTGCGAASDELSFAIDRK